MAENQAARMAKWDDLTETISNQIKESRELVEQAKNYLAQLKDKVSFVLLIPPTPPPPPGQKEPTEEGGDAPVLHTGGGPTESALTAKLGGISSQLDALNGDDMRELCTQISHLIDLVDV